MRKILLSAIAAMTVFGASAEVEGTYTAAVYKGYTVGSNYKFDTTDFWSNDSEDADPWEVTITKSETGYSIYNLIDWEETLEATYDEATGILTIAGGALVEDGYKLFGGLGSYVTADAYMDFVNQYNGYVPDYALKPVKLQVSDDGIKAITPIMTYQVYDSYTGYIGYAYDVTAILELAKGGSAVETVEADDVNAPVEYYNLQGVRVASPAPGKLVIKRQGSNVAKIVVR